MRFQVPQFIEVEDKIFGPLTFKQFIYLAGGGGLCVALFLSLPKIVAIIPALAVAATSVSLAFYKINNRPFIVFVESMFRYLINPKLYTWRKTDSGPAIDEFTNAIKAPTPRESVEIGGFIPKLGNSKLKDLSWSLDTKEALNPATKGDGTQA
jgi:hypothetical protein